MILLFDTSTSHIAIGLATDAGEILAEFHADANPNERGIHDARLASEAEKLLVSIGKKASEIYRIGLIIGPGSFTGLRIGLAFAKGLAFATDAEIVPLTQHEVLQFANSEHDGYIITHGYRPELFYLAESSSPRDIRIMTGDEIEKLPAKPTIALGKFVSLSLAAMAQMTTYYLSPSSRASIDAIEPLYLTEFKPGKI